MQMRPHLKLVSNLFTIPWYFGFNAHHFTGINDVCNDFQFACSSEIEGSDCTSIRYVCDGSDDCSDGSDERQDYCCK